MDKVQRALVGVLIASQLASCGGGNNATPNPPAASVTVNVQRALADLAKSGLSGSFTLSGWKVAASGPTSVVIAGTGSAAEGQAALIVNSSFGPDVLTQALSLIGSGTIEGQLFANTGLFGITSVRNSSNYALVGESTGNYYASYHSTSSPPTAVQDGSTGKLASGILYLDESMTTQIGTVTESHSVGPDTPNSLLVTFTQNQYNTAGQPTVQTQTTYRIDASGNFTLVSIVDSETGAAGSTGMSGSVPSNWVYQF